MKCSMKKSRAQRQRVSSPPDSTGVARARAALPSLPITLAALVAKEGTRWRVKVADHEAAASVDPSVDPALLDEALVTGARVLVEVAGEPVIVGALATRRALTLAPDDTVHVRARAVTVDASEELLLRSPGAFLRMKGGEVETYGQRVAHTARELFKVLGRMVKIN